MKTTISTPLLAYANNWEADEYSVGGSRVTSLKQVRIAGELFAVSSEVVSVGYTDHGHYGHGTSTHYFIKVVPVGASGSPIKVLATKIDLNTLVEKTAIEPTKFSVKNYF